MDTTIQGFYLNIPKADVKFFRQLAKKWDGLCLLKKVCWTGMSSLVLKMLNCLTMIFYRS